jgi:Asp-tRNA(Asn)/Glu-tRNA(Gln) amidotransferase A subunit family amidase
VARAGAQRFTELAAAVETTSEVWDDWWPQPTVMMNPIGVSHEQYQAAEDARNRWWEGLQRVLHHHDLLLSPTIQHVAFGLDQWNAAWSTASSDYPNGSFVPTWTAHTFIHNWLGWPALSLPCGFVDGLPVGLQITAKPNNEALIVRAANAYLGAFQLGQRPPLS